MKRIISLLITIAIMLSTLASCTVLDDVVDILDSYVDLGEQGGLNRPSGYRYKDFTNAEKAILTEYVGEIIPFAPCNNYYFEGVSSENDFSDGVNYYTVGNTRADFTSYVDLLADYELVDTYVDDYDDVWYVYTNGNIYIEISYYFYAGISYIDVIAYPVTDDGNTDSGDNGSDLFRIGA